MNARSYANGRLPASGAMVHQCAMLRPIATTLFVAATGLAGCTQFPALDRTVTPALEAAPYPTLVPIEPLLARASATGADPAATEAGLRARVARLQARAAGLRGGVLSGAARQRLSEGLR